MARIDVCGVGRMLKILAGHWGSKWKELRDSSGRTAGQHRGLVKAEKAEMGFGVSKSEGKRVPAWYSALANLCSLAGSTIK